jgi:hypothetical protein
MLQWDERDLSSNVAKDGAVKTEAMHTLKHTMHVGDDIGHEMLFT